MYKIRFCIGLGLLFDTICRVRGSVWGQHFSKWLTVVGIPVEGFFLCRHIDKGLDHRLGYWERFEGASKSCAGMFRLMRFAALLSGANLGTKIPAIWWIGQGHRLYGMSVIKVGISVHTVLLSSTVTREERAYEGLSIVRHSGVFLAAACKVSGFSPETLLRFRLAKLSLTLVRVLWIVRLKGLQREAKPAQTS